MTKEAVQIILAQAQAALASAPDEQAQALRNVIARCQAALTRTKRSPGYPGGRLDTSHASPAYEAVRQLDRQFPGLLDGEEEEEVSGR